MSLLTSISAMQAENVHDLFLFMGDMNGHHQEWLDSTITTDMVLLPSPAQLFSKHHVTSDMVLLPSPAQLFSVVIRW